MKRTYLIMIIFPVMSLLMAQNDVELLGHLPYNEDLSDVWGYVDETGNEYALVGVYNGFSVVDVSDPANPEEVYFLAGPQSIWRDLKTWGDYAYISNESSQGVLIVDLSPLPDGPITSTTNFTGSSFAFQSAHNLYIDESGKLYIFGADNGSGGAIICDVSASPMNPVELGRFNNYYLHDGMARGDTLWGAAIYQGELLAIDVSNPVNPVIMGSVSTPGQFAHNCWVSDNGTHVFTTDEISSGYIGAYNVEDLGNIFETDRIQSSPGTNVIPHNVHVRNDFLITSYYTDGIVIHDASNPENITQVGQYDTSPNYSGSGYHGSWGAYPFLPSGNILASDIEEGLYILGFDFVRAAFVQGVVKDSLAGIPLFNVAVEVLGTELATQTLFDGSFEFAATFNGTYNLKFSKDSYETKILEDVEFVQGETVNLEVELTSTIAVSIDEDSFDRSLEIFPNPTNKNFTLNIKNDLSLEKPISMTIFDVVGTPVGSYQLQPNSGEMRFGESLPAGIYFIGIGDGVQKTTKRVVKF